MWEIFPFALQPRVLSHVLLLDTYPNRINMHEERNNKHENEDAVPAGAIPSYLMDRAGVSRAKVLSNTVKQKRKEKAGKWSVPIPKVRAIADDEMFKILKSGKRRSTYPTSIFFLFLSFSS